MPQTIHRILSKRPHNINQTQRLQRRTNTSRIHRLVIRLAVHRRRRNHPNSQQRTHQTQHHNNSQPRPPRTNQSHQDQPLSLSFPNNIRTTPARHTHQSPGKIHYNNNYPPPPATYPRPTPPAHTKTPDQNTKNNPPPRNQIPRPGNIPPPTSQHYFTASDDCGVRLPRFKASNAVRRRLPRRALEWATEIRRQSPLGPSVSVGSKVTSLT